MPEKILSSHVAVQEEMMQKVTIGLDHMLIEDDVEGNEDVEYIELIEVPDSENVSEIVLENALENNT